jgi:hypothetical protein
MYKWRAYMLSSLPKKYTLEEFLDRGIRFGVMTEISGLSNIGKIHECLSI